MMKNFYYFEGGLGDIIRQMHERSTYHDLGKLHPHDDPKTIVVASHSPYAAELFTQHPSADCFDIRLAERHYLTALQKELPSLERKEYICSCVGLDFVLEDRGLDGEYFPAIPQTNPLYFYGVDRSQTNIVVAPWAYDSHKDINLEQTLEHLAYTKMANKSNIFVISRSPVPYKVPYPFRQLSPNVPDTLQIVLAADLVISAHSCLAQFAALRKKHLIVGYPDNSPDFKVENWGKDYTKYFTTPTKTKCIPKSLWGSSAVGRAIHELMDRPF